MIRRVHRRGCSNLACRCWASAMACRRWPSQLGGKVENGKVREFGYAEVRARGHTALLKGISDFVTSEGHGMLKVWMSHGDKVNRDAAWLQADGVDRALSGSRHGGRRTAVLCVQFHAEVTHTLQGKDDTKSRVRARNLRLQVRLEHAGLHRRSGRGNPPARSVTTKSFSVCPAASTAALPRR
jgi:hypothetical protein